MRYLLALVLIAGCADSNAPAPMPTITVDVTAQPTTSNPGWCSVTWFAWRPHYADSLVVQLSWAADAHFIGVNGINGYIATRDVQPPWMVKWRVAASQSFVPDQRDSARIDSGCTVHRY